MATLSSVTASTRKILEWTVILIGGIILLVVVFRVGTFLKEMFAPTPPAPPTVAFGKIPETIFPQQFMPQITYTVNTVSGGLPQLPDRMTVYGLSQPQATLLNLDKAKSMVKSINFLDSPIQVSDTTYKWTKSSPIPSSVTIDTQSFDFFLTSSYKTNDVVKGAAQLPDEESARTAAQQFFDAFQPLPKSIDTNKTKTSLLALHGSELIPATSLSTAQIIRVDYFPTNLGTLPIYAPIPDQALDYALVSSSDTPDPWIVEAQYYHKDITNDKATYPIKTASAALDDLKNGKGYIAANPANSTSVTISNVSLGYYVDTSPQKYLWPIIVFQGDKGFFAYVSALEDNWIQK